MGPEGAKVLTSPGGVTLSWENTQAKAAVTHTGQGSGGNWQVMSTSSVGAGGFGHQSAGEEKAHHFLCPRWHPVATAARVWEDSRVIWELCCLGQVTSPLWALFPHFKEHGKERIAEPSGPLLLNFFS